jgi:hypothetical protein
LADQTAANVVDEYDTVTLQAGYENGHYGIIFSGQVKQYKRGRENAVESYLTIYAADGDLAHNHATVNEVLPAQHQLSDRYNTFRKSVQNAQPGLGVGNEVKTLPGGFFPRDRVLFGMTQHHIRDYVRDSKTSWFIAKGQLYNVGEKDYLPGTAVVLTAQTGLVGVPESTENGIRLRCLLNPAIEIGGQVQLANKGINQYNAPGGGPAANITFPNYTDLRFFAPVSTDGFYAVAVIDYDGDTHGQPWYNDMICYAIDPSLTEGGVTAGAIWSTE